jgi:hypothetical protein
MNYNSTLEVNVDITCEGVPSRESDLYRNRRLARRPSSRPTFS